MSNANSFRFGPLEGIAALFVIIAIIIAVLITLGCTLNYKMVNVDVDTPSSVRFGDVRNENLSEGITASPRLQAAENVEAKLK
jgi:hypothetical protein